MKSSDRFQTLSDWSRRALTVAVALLTVLAIGCGGNGAGRVLGAPLGTPTRATSTKITFVWPKRSRLIPIAANSINLTLTTPGHTYPKLITRPEAATSDTSLITFDNIVPGDYTVTAQAFPNSDGTGNVQATGSSTFTVAQGVQGSFTVTMLSTVTKVTITGPTTLLVGKNGTFTAKAYDAADVAVLVDPSTIQWTLPTDTRHSALSGSQVTLKPILGFSANTVTATYQEPGVSNPTATVNLDALDPYFVLGNALFGGGTDDTTARSLTDIAGDATLNKLFVPNDIGGASTALLQANDRMNPVASTSLITPGGTSKVLTTEVDGAGNLFAAVQTGAGTSLYFGARNTTPSVKYALVSGILDMAVDGSKNVYVLYTQGATTAVKKYDSSGAASVVGITTDATSRHIAADELGNVYVDGANIRRLSPANVESTPLGTVTETVLDLEATDGNVYAMLTPGGNSLAHIAYYTAEGDLLADIDTQAFFYDSDTLCRLSVDEATGDIYMGRNFPDVGLYECYEVATLFIQ